MITRNLDIATSESGSATRMISRPFWCYTWFALFCPFGPPDLGIGTPDVFMPSCGSPDLQGILQGAIDDDDIVCPIVAVA